MPVINLTDPNHWKVDRRASALAKSIAADGRPDDKLSSREVAQLLGYSTIWWAQAVGSGGKVHYTVQDVKRYLDVLSQLRSFKLVVFLDSDKRVVAYMEAWALKELVEQTETEFAGEFVKFINSGQKDDVADNPNVAKKTISASSTNIEALREMQAQNLEALVVVDEQTMLCGVIEREQVLTSIMLSLVT